MLGLSDTVWPAFVLSLMIGVILGMQRYARQKDLADSKDYAHVFSYPGGRRTAEVFLTRQVASRLRIASVIGIVFGAGLTVLTLPRAALADHPLITGWFFVTESIVSMLFARGFVMSTRSAQLFSQAIQNDLMIDLLRIDRLSVIGRNGARTRVRAGFALRAGTIGRAGYAWRQRPARASLGDSQAHRRAHGAKPAAHRSARHHRV